MARPFCIEFAGALYHVPAHGNAREDIYHNDIDRQQFLLLLQNIVNRYDWYCHAYCLMDNHYHLLIETNSPTLSNGMKYLNGTYPPYFNRQHQRVGHVFQGRFKAILVQKNAYLLKLARYIALNPVRAQMVRSAKATIRVKPYNLHHYPNILIFNKLKFT
ncbi:transposase [Nitrosomonas communis]|uniref:REP element-mobilizing transposase RayT n=1 Tax=Nitrosomonas communis TaxID=44574 RepID=A0A1I4U217_9PROT|nr:transposase [Nitrosomonas communis]SFM83086.1 REP element-mobilizing transposase RayT [Nitrosomonas communis]